MKSTHFLFFILSVTLLLSVRARVSVSDYEPSTASTSDYEASTAATSDYEESATLTSDDESSTAYTSDDESSTASTVDDDEVSTEPTTEGDTASTEASTAFSTEASTAYSTSNRRTSDQGSLISLVRLTVVVDGVEEETAVHLVELGSEASVSAAAFTDDAEVFRVERPQPGSGTQKVTLYNFDTNRDVLDLSAFPDIASKADLNIDAFTKSRKSRKRHVTVADSTKVAIRDKDANVEVSLLDVNAADLEEKNFLFSKHNSASILADSSSNGAASQVTVSLLAAAVVQFAAMTLSSS